MVTRAIRTLLRVGPPQQKVEASSMHCDFKNHQRPPHKRAGSIELRFFTIMSQLALPQRNAQDALDDAVMAGTAFLKLQQLLRAV